MNETKGRFSEFARVMEDNLVAFRRERGQRRSQAEFARFVGAAPNNMSKYLSGDTMPTPENLEQMYSVLGDPRLYTSLGLTPPTPNIPGADHLLKLYALLPEKGREEVIRRAEELEQAARKLEQLPE
jgi:transcriptional regulator with XRE-family HTH domain